LYVGKKMKPERQVFVFGVQEKQNIPHEDYRLKADNGLFYFVNDIFRKS
jgi:hypothetical protein